MNNWLLFLFLLLMHGVFGAEMDETEPVTVTEGDSVSLHTNLSELLNDDTILWMFGPKDFPLSQIKRKDNLTSFFVTDDERFRGRLQVDQKTGSLTIRNTRIRLSGQYKVKISREKITIEKIFGLTVIGVVGETDGVKSVSISVTEGQSVTLPMDAEMHIDALMLWRFGDKGILLAKIDVETNETSLNNADERFRDRLKLDQTGSLTIENTRTTDSGLYELQIRDSECSCRFLLSVIDPGLSSGAIAGIFFGVLIPVLLFAAAAFGMIYFRHRISKSKKQMAVACEEKEEIVTEGDSPTLHTGLTEIHVTSVSVKEGRSVLLHTAAEIQTDDIILWTFGPKNRLVVKSESGKMNIGMRFKDQLDLDQTTGSLTIRNIGITDSGLFNLQIINSEQTIFRGFCVTVTDSTGEQVNGITTVVTPLLNEEVTDGTNEEQAASPV